MSDYWPCTITDNESRTGTQLPQAISPEIRTITRYVNVAPTTLRHRPTVRVSQLVLPRASMQRETSSSASAAPHRTPRFAQRMQQVLLHICSVLGSWPQVSSWGRMVPPACPLGMAQQKLPVDFLFVTSRIHLLRRPSARSLRSTHFVTRNDRWLLLSTLVCHSRPGAEKRQPAVISWSPAQVVRLAAACRIGTLIHA